jgi:hypothetical protein
MYVCSKHPPRKLSGTAEIAVSERSTSYICRIYEFVSKSRAFCRDLARAARAQSTAPETLSGQIN